MTAHYSEDALIASPSVLDPRFDWLRVARLLLTSRVLDHIEEKELLPAKKIVYQFSARGHELSQILLGTLLSHPYDAVSAYYRSRPLLLTLGVSVEDALSGPLAKAGGYSDGRDIGVVCNFPNPGGPTVLPMAGDVGSQYTPASGWAEALQYQHFVLGRGECKGAISVVLGGEGSIASNGFWSALTMATTLNLPQLFFIEDNGYAISVPADKQTPGGNIADNLRSFRNLHIIECSGTAPAEAADCIAQAVEYVRFGETPALIRLEVPRLSGHSGQDTQAYKTSEELREEQSRDPLPQLREYLAETIGEAEWSALAEEVEQEVRSALEAALARPEPEAESIQKYVYFDSELSSETVGGLPHQLCASLPHSDKASPEGPRINMLEGIRKVLAHELAINPTVVVFGEDVGPKGGVHAATSGLQELFGEDRVYDTSLSEEGIIGRAVGMALAGLVPVAEIQFRKYADPATEQLNNCGTIRWRTANRFAAPIVVRMAGGFARRAGDPWHSVSGEAIWLHQTGWHFAIPSNAEDAVGLLRTALRSQDPTFFFEHRALLDAADARRQYPGDDFVIPFGKARLILEGTALTVVTWGAMVERCLNAATAVGEELDLIDLRTLSPWDREAVFSSVRKTKRCLIVHEDGLNVGFGAEIAAQLAEHLFIHLDAPIRRLAPANIPIPYNERLMQAVVPTVDVVAQAMRELLEF